MKLVKARIRNFQCIHDSEEFSVDDITCLVGKNQSGKTAILKALNLLNPLTGTIDAKEIPEYFSTTYHEEDINVNVVEATFIMEKEDIQTVHDFLKCECLNLTTNTPTIKVIYRYTAGIIIARDLDIDIDIILNYISSVTGISIPSNIKDQKKVADYLINSINKNEQKSIDTQYTDILSSVIKNDLSQLVFDKVIHPKQLLPETLYVNTYGLIKGDENLDAIVARFRNPNPGPPITPDDPILNLLSMTSTNFGTIINANNSQSRMKLIEDVQSNLEKVSRDILEFWNQYKNYEAKFRIHPAMEDDPTDMTRGVNLWFSVNNIESNIETKFGNDSSGFIWFFSFLVWLTDITNRNKNIVLLLDEPGLSLHGTAQGDLINFFKNITKDGPQIVYTTHSLAMIDPNFNGVRIVENWNIEEKYNSKPAKEKGTKVRDKIFHARQGSLFPLQAAIGYEIYQTLFIGPNVLIVEGASDLKYIQILNDLIKKKSAGTTLSLLWTISPAGSFERVISLSSLLKSNTKLNIAALVDYEKNKENQIEELKKIVGTDRVFTCREFSYDTKVDGADIEDIFEPQTYIEIVNSQLGTQINLNDLKSNNPRIVNRVKDYFKSHPNEGDFRHSQVAFHLAKNLDSLENTILHQDIERFVCLFKKLNDLL